MFPGVPCNNANAHEYVVHPGVASSACSAGSPFSPECLPGLCVPPCGTEDGCRWYPRYPIQSSFLFYIFMWAVAFYLRHMGLLMDAGDTTFVLNKLLHFLKGNVRKNTVYYRIDVHAYGK